MNNIEKTLKQLLTLKQVQALREFYKLEGNYTKLQQLEKKYKEILEQDLELTLTKGEIYD